MPISKVSQAGLSSGAQFNTFKNRIINGGMDIDQRNAGASYAQSTTAIYGLDRWKTDIDIGSGRWNVQRVADAPSGFNYSLKVTITTQEAQPSNAALHQVYQITEGFNTADFAYGTVNATPVTISFWVKSSIVGIQSVNLHSGDYCYTTSYVINVANTWEYKQVTIPGATAGTWSTDTGSGILMVFNIGGGTSQIRTPNTWSAQTTTGIVSGSVYLPATNGATWQVTGVQLEKGSTATSFDYRPYTTELQLCQRYYYRITAQIPGDYTIATTTTAISTTQTFTITNFPVSMRTRPTALEQSGTVSDYVVVRCGSATFVNCSAVPSFSQAGLNSAMSIFTVASGLTNGAAGLVYGNTTNAYLGWSAEL